MLDKAAAAGVVVLFRCGRAAEAVAQVLEDMRAKPAQPRVGDRRAEALDVGVVALLFFAGDRVSGEEVGDGGVVEGMPREVVRIDAVLVLRPLAFEADDGVVGEFFRGVVDQ